MFENFNLLQYTLLQGDKTLKDFILTDLTKRTKLTANKNVLARLKLNAGDTPESISNELYGTPYYHWTIMMVNDIFDINKDWFMHDDQLYDFAVAKYNVVVTVQPAAVNVTTNVVSYPGHKFNPNDIVQLTGNGLPGGLFANTNYYIFNTTVDTFQLTTISPPASIEQPAQVAVDITSAGSAAMTITCDKLSLLAYWVDEQDNIMSAALDSFEGWSNDDTTRIDYNSKMHDMIFNSYSRQAAVPPSNKTITDLGDDVVDVVEVETASWETSTPTFHVITNYQYEEMINNYKKDILVIKPQYIKEFVDKFNIAVAS